MSFEYKVVPAPRRGVKARGVKTSEDRFALALAQALNDEAAEGWEFVRAETLPLDERSGLTGTKTSMQNLLVFRRGLDAQADAPPRPDPAPEGAAPRLGAATVVSAGAAPALGPARGPVPD
jgi:Domain of unknown function (DUF4177)